MLLPVLRQSLSVQVRSAGSEAVILTGTEVVEKLQAVGVWRVDVMDSGVVFEPWMTMVKARAERTRVVVVLEVGHLAVAAHPAAGVEKSLFRDSLAEPGPNEGAPVSSPDEAAELDFGLAEEASLVLDH